MFTVWPIYLVSYFNRRVFFSFDANFVSSWSHVDTAVFYYISLFSPVPYHFILNVCFINLYFGNDL